jgi:hypothetical protein
MLLRPVLLTMRTNILLQPLLDADHREDVARGQHHTAPLLIQKIGMLSRPVLLTRRKSSCGLRLMLTTGKIWREASITQSAAPDRESRNVIEACSADKEDKSSAAFPCYSYDLLRGRQHITPLLIQQIISEGKGRELSVKTGSQQCVCYNHYSLISQLFNVGYRTGSTMT